MRDATDHDRLLEERIELGLGLGDLGIKFSRALMLCAPNWALAVVRVRFIRIHLNVHRFGRLLEPVLLVILFLHLVVGRLDLTRECDPPAQLLE